MQTIDAAEPRHDLGVLFVHGIGQNRRGEALLNFGEPLREAIAQLVMPAAAGASERTSASISAAWLSDSGKADPARAEISIEGAAGSATGGSASTSRWLFAEAWWAEQFPTPGFRDIANWSFTVLPATLISHADRRFRRAGFAFVRALEGAPPFAGLLNAVGGVLREGGLLTLAMAATPLLLAIVVLLLLLALPPFTVTRDLAGALQRTLAATVGDSYVFMRQPMSAAAITTEVRTKLEWLAARCRKVVVVAHSQGAAVAHSVLRGPLTAPCDLFVTFGSGLGKLSEMQHGDTHRGERHLWLAAAAGLLAVTGVALAAVVGWRNGGGALGLLSAAMQILLVVEIGYVGLLVVLARFAHRPKTPPALRADPVPASPDIDVPIVRAVTPDVGGRPADVAKARFWQIAQWPIAVACGVTLFIALVEGSGSSADAPLKVVLALSIAMGIAVAFSAVAAWREESSRSADPKLQWLRDRALFASEYALHKRGNLRWVDLYSSADPVPNGPLLDQFEPTSLDSIEVFNRHSALWDHTIYLNASDDFVQRVARLLIDQVALRTRPVRSFRAISRRRWRVTVLRLARVVCAAEAVAIALHWTSEPPQWLVAALEFTSRKIAAAAPSWLIVALQWMGGLSAWMVVPVLAAALWWALCARWEAWGKVENAIYLRIGDYERAPRHLWVMAGTLLAGAMIVAQGAGGWGAVAAVAALAVAGCLLVALWEPLAARYTLWSRSGAETELDRLETERLSRAMGRAMQHRDADRITGLAQQLRGRDDALALKALERAARDLNSPNAALALGSMFETMAEKADDPAEKARHNQSAVAAFENGASLGDPVAAWNAAYRFRKMGRESDAQRLDKRAFVLGDSMSAHSLGSALMKDAGQDDTQRLLGRAYYEDGTRRGDPLSALFLAQHLESLGDGLEGDLAIRQKREAVAQYRVAFDLGVVAAAQMAGRLLRALGDIPQARRALVLGTRMRDSGSALALGDLEREDEEDVEAARSAYREAISLDLTGRDTAFALFALGGLLEAQGRASAAMLRYREALRIDAGAQAAAQAGLNLARLLEVCDRSRHLTEIENTLLRAVKLSPVVAADAYGQFMVRNQDVEGVADLSLELRARMQASTLASLADLLRFSNPGRQLELLQEAVSRGAYAEGADEAAAALLTFLDWKNNNAALKEAMDAIATRDPYRAEQVGKLLEGDNRTWLAKCLQEAARDAGAAAAVVKPAVTSDTVLMPAANESAR